MMIMSIETDKTFHLSRYGGAPILSWSRARRRRSNAAPSGWSTSDTFTWNARLASSAPTHCSPGLPHKLPHPPRTGSRKNAPRIARFVLWTVSQRPLALSFFLVTWLTTPARINSRHRKLHTNVALSKPPMDFSCNVYVAFCFCPFDRNGVREPEGADEDCSNNRCSESRLPTPVCHSIISTHTRKDLRRQENGDETSTTVRIAAPRKAKLHSKSQPVQTTTI